MKQIPQSRCAFMCYVLSLVLLLALSVRAQTQPLANPASPPAPPDDGHPTLWLVGDSTMHVNGKGQMGWGQVIDKYFDTDRIHVQNRAVGGRSSRTFIAEGKWEAILAICKPGDFVLLQMGHNDASPVNDKTRARGTLKGIGPETQEIDNELTGKHETIHTYGWYMRKYVDDAKAKHMTIIICSPVPRLPKKPPHVGDTDQNGYVQWAQQIAEEKKVPFIQLNGLILNKYAGLDPVEIKAKYFTPADNTHVNPNGAELNAQCVVEGIRGLKECKLKEYLKPEDSATMKR